MVEFDSHENPTLYKETKMKKFLLVIILVVLLLVGCVSIERGNPWKVYDVTCGENFHHLIAAEYKLLLDDGIWNYRMYIYPTGEKVTLPSFGGWFNPSNPCIYFETSIEFDGTFQP